MFDKRLMKLCPESRKYIIGNIVLQWLELVLNAVMIGIVSFLIEELAESGRWDADLLLPVLLITVIARFFITRGAVRMSWLASSTVKKKLRGLIYDKLLRLGERYHEHVTTAELVQESVEGTEQLESYFGQYVPQFFYAFLAPLTLFVLFGIRGSWKTALVLLIAVPLIPGAIMMVQKIAKRILSRYWGKYTELGSSFLENLQGMTTLKTYQADAYKNEQMNRESEEFRRVTMMVLTMQLNSVTIMDFVAYGGAAIGIIIASGEFLNGRIGIADAIFMILLSADFFLPMRRLGSYFHVAMNGMAASDRIFRFLNTEDPAEGSLSAAHGDIVMDRVSFSYDGEREVLHEISLKAVEHQFIGIVGESGSGKSTIASMIMGRIQPTSGTVSLAGIPIAEIKRDSLMKEITAISSGSVFFKGTLRENLSVNGEYSDQEMIQALAKAQLHELLNNGKGLDTELLENAENLSGGQRQRLAIARAYLLNSPVWILDEATSNIDSESEELILNSILAERNRRTLIFITHRLANTAAADHIYCLKDGKVAEHGTHRELLAQDGEYAKLWNTQIFLEQYGKEEPK